MTRIQKFIQAFKLLLLSCLLYACSDSNDSEQLASGGKTADQPSSVMVIGDSMSTGFGITSPWPTRVAEHMDISIHNFSISGEETSYGLGIVAERLEQHQPNTLIILLGTNDAIRGSIPNALSNLQQMVDIAVAKNVEPIVATLPLIPRSAREDQRATEINSGIRKLDHATIIDLRPLLNASHIADGVHPNNDGQQLIADAFVSLLESI